VHVALFPNGGNERRTACDGIDVNNSGSNGSNDVIARRGEQACDGIDVNNGANGSNGGIARRGEQTRDGICVDNSSGDGIAGLGGGVSVVNDRDKGVLKEGQRRKRGQRGLRKH